MQMEQNSKEWLEWRRGGLGASDAPIVMGDSPYLTAYELWQEKTGLVKREDTGSFVTDLGHKFEPMIRADLELDLGYSMDPQCIEHHELPWLRASLDGFNEENRTFVEIKYVGKDKLEWVKKNKRPLPAHVAQVQQQFAVTGFSSCLYTCYTLTPDRKQIDRSVTITVPIDMEYITKKLVPALKDFWDKVQAQKAPELSDKDVVVVKKKEAVELSELYLKKVSQKKDLETEIKDIQKKMIEAIKEKPLGQIGRVKMTKVVRVGSVDYSKIKELKSINLDQYRKASSSSYKMTEIKG